MTQSQGLLRLWYHHPMPSMGRPLELLHARTEPREFPAPDQQWMLITAASASLKARNYLLVTSICLPLIISDQIWFYLYIGRLILIITCLHPLHISYHSNTVRFCSPSSCPAPPALSVTGPPHPRSSRSPGVHGQHGEGGGSPHLLRSCHTCAHTHVHTHNLFFLLTSLFVKDTSF